MSDTSGYSGNGDFPFGLDAEALMPARTEAVFGMPSGPTNDPTTEGLESAVVSLTEYIHRTPKGEGRRMWFGVLNNLGIVAPPETDETVEESTYDEILILGIDEADPGLCAVIREVFAQRTGAEPIDDSADGSDFDELLQRANRRTALVTPKEEHGEAAINRALTKRFLDKTGAGSTDTNKNRGSVKGAKPKTVRRPSRRNLGYSH